MLSNVKSKSTGKNQLNIDNDIQKNIKFLKERLENCTDIIYRNMKMSDISLYIIYIDGLIDKMSLMQQVIDKLLSYRDLMNTKEDLIEQIAYQIPITEVKIIEDLNTGAYEIINGKVLIFVDNTNRALSISINKYSNTDESTIEPAILGPKESFTKILSNNTALIRRYLNNEDCKIINMELGKLFKKRCSVIYLESTANKNIINEVCRRLNTIDLDIVIDASNLAELIQDEPYSPFPTVTITERVDKAACSLLEGQVVIILDNSAFALITPSVLMGFFHSTEDYYNRFYLASVLRMLRIISYLLSIFLPGFYTAITLFNQELIPTKLLVSIATQTAFTPFSSTIELIIMLFAFEMLRELGVRLPKNVGSTVSLVGALIIGETVVRAGLVSTFIVIITAFTAISSMILTTFQMYESIIVCRILTILLGSILGIWGVIISFLIISAHLCSMKSFGVPYVYSLISNNIKGLDDIIVRAPLWEKNNKFLFKRKNKFK